MDFVFNFMCISVRPVQFYSTNSKISARIAAIITISINIFYLNNYLKTKKNILENNQIFKHF